MGRDRTYWIKWNDFNALSRFYLFYHIQEDFFDFANVRYPERGGKIKEKKVD